MNKKISAGILVYRQKNEFTEVFLVHPGGPFFKNKDFGYWSIPKGEIHDGENLFETAKREFNEEVGVEIDGNFIELFPIEQKNKKVFAWAVEGDIEQNNLKSNFFQMEYPPNSGMIQSFPEVDKGEWFSVPEAKIRINENQAALINELCELLINDKERNI